MANKIQFQKTLVDTIIDLLKTGTYPNFFRHFYYGDPGDIPIDNYPCICVEKVKTEITHGPTQMDELNTTIDIILMYNKKNDYGKQPHEVHGKRMLEQYAEGIDPTTSQYDTNTVAGLLRKNFTLGYLITDQDLLIEYGVSPRPSSLAAVCRITARIEQLKIVEGRV